MTAPRPDRTRSDLILDRSVLPALAEAAIPPAAPARARLPNERARPARRDNPDAPATPPRRSPERQPRTYTSPEPAPRRHARKNENPTTEKPTLEELDRWDEEWRDEWDRGDVDDSAAYDEEQLDVAEQARDVEWLLDALDALDDTGECDAFDWDE